MPQRLYTTQESFQLLPLGGSVLSFALKKTPYHCPSPNASADNHMKITEVKVYKFSVETGGSTFAPHTGEKISSDWKSWLFLKIETDAGIHGWGDGSGEWLAAPAAPESKAILSNHAGTR